MPKTSILLFFVLLTIMVDCTDKRAPKGPKNGEDRRRGIPEIPRKATTKRIRDQFVITERLGTIPFHTP
jgi:hypothetical protein